MKPLEGRPPEPTRGSMSTAIALGLLLVLLAPVLDPIAAAQELGRTPGDPSISQRIQALPAIYRKWVQDVGGLMTYPELEYFLELRQDYRRDAFMEAFWEPRSADLRARFDDYLRATGQIEWRDPRVLASDRLIVVGSNREIWSISPYTGQLLGWVKASGPLLIAPVVANDTVYLLTDEARLLALR